MFPIFSTTFTCTPLIKLNSTTTIRTKSYFITQVIMHNLKGLLLEVPKYASLTIIFIGHKCQTILLWFDLMESGLPRKVHCDTGKHE